MVLAQNDNVCYMASRNVRFLPGQGRDGIAGIELSARILHRLKCCTEIEKSSETDRGGAALAFDNPPTSAPASAAAPRGGSLNRARFCAVRDGIARRGGAPSFGLVNECTRFTYRPDQ